jgi:signal transduction histidine kinase
MRQVHRGTLAWSLGLTLLVAGLLIVAAVVADAPVAADGVVYLSGFLVMAVSGCLVVGLRPRHAIGWVFVGGGAGTLLASLLGGVAPILTGQASAWVGMLSLELFALTWIAVTTLPLLLFPDGRPRGVWARAGVWTVGVASVLAAACVAVGARPDMAAPVSPLAIEGWADAAGQLLDAVLFASAGLTVGAAVLLALRWRRSDGLDRRRLAWLGVGGLVLAALVVAGWVAMTFAPDLPDIVGATVESLQVAVIPLSMLGAIVDARLFDIDVVFRRSLVSAVLLGLVVGVYAMAIAVASLVAGQSAPVLGSLVASVVVAFALSPARDLLSRQVERRLYGSRRRPAEALALVGAGLAGAGAPPATDAVATLSAAASAIGSGLRLASVRISVDGEPPLLAGWDAAAAASVESGASRFRPDDLVEFPLTAFGETVGHLSVATAPGDTLTAADTALMRQISPQVALLAHAVRAAAAVQRSRENIVNAREEERMRLRRDLHDGLGPALVGLALEADAATALAASDAVRAGELTARVAAGLRGMVSDVRSVVEGLRPPDIDQLGLAAALEERARALSVAGVAVTIECEPLALSPAAEVAVYRVVAEAVTNVARHARAASCHIRVSDTAGLIVVEVDDDGRGFDPDAARGGVGVGSMRARAEEIGGTLTISSGPTGTRVRAVLPATLRPAASPTGTATPQTAPNRRAVQPAEGVHA